MTFIVCACVCCMYVCMRYEPVLADDFSCVRKGQKSTLGVLFGFLKQGSSLNPELIDLTNLAIQ